VTTATTRRPAEVRAWLAERPSPDELAAAYPQLWRSVQREVGELLTAQGAAALPAYVERTARRGARLGPAAELEQEVRRRLVAEAVRRVSLSAATGQAEGVVRFNRFSGTIAQRLLFREGLERKPASMAWFRLLWPLVGQRRFLMPLVEPQGIYCFYSRALIRALRDLIGDRTCLEVAAGDGTLSRFLRAEGVDVTATDDHSWSGRVAFPADVVRQEAREALRRRAPEVVLCSWPPAGNPFERHVFTTPSVQLYVVIASRHEFASGDWDAYRRQRGFTFAEAPELSRLVLPPELDCGVYVFRREPSGQTTSANGSSPAATSAS
jgi:hypothetical protein